MLHDIIRSRLPGAAVFLFVAITICALAACQPIQPPIIQIDGPVEMNPADGNIIWGITTTPPRGVKWTNIMVTIDFPQELTMDRRYLNWYHRYCCYTYTLKERQNGQSTLYMEFQTNSLLVETQIKTVRACVDAEELSAPECYSHTLLLTPTRERPEAISNYPIEVKLEYAPDQVPVTVEGGQFHAIVKVENKTAATIGQAVVQLSLPYSVTLAPYSDWRATDSGHIEQEAPTLHPFQTQEMHLVLNIGEDAGGQDDLFIGICGQYGTESWDNGRSWICNTSLKFSILSEVHANVTTLEPIQVATDGTVQLSPDMIGTLNITITNPFTTTVGDVRIGSKFYEPFKSYSTQFLDYDSKSRRSWTGYFNLAGQQARQIEIPIQSTDLLTLPFGTGLNVCTDGREVVASCETFPIVVLPPAPQFQVEIYPDRDYTTVGVAGFEYTFVLKITNTGNMASTGGIAELFIPHGTWFTESRSWQLEPEMHDWQKYSIPVPPLNPGEYEIYYTDLKLPTDADQITIRGCGSWEPAIAPGNDVPSRCADFQIDIIDAPRG